MYVTEAMELRPEAAFLHHARGVNTFSWKRHTEQSKFCSRDILTCIEDETAAMYLLEHHSDQDAADSDHAHYLKGVVLNNLTFMRSYSREGEFARIFDLDQARVSFESLVNTVPKDQWPRTPKYFHTEAYLEYQMARAFLEERLERLNNALKAIQRALQYRPGEEKYQRFRTQIETALRRPVTETPSAPV